MLGKTLALVAAASTVMLIIVVNTTTPSTIGPLGILLVFVLIYAIFLGIFTPVLYYAIPAFGRLRMTSAVREARTVRRNMHAAYYYASVIALAPVMIIGMQSVANIGVYELILVGLFVLLSCLYITKRVY